MGAWSPASSRLLDHQPPLTPIHHCHQLLRAQFPHLFHNKSRIVSPWMRLGVFPLLRQCPLRPATNREREMRTITTHIAIVVPQRHLQFQECHRFLLANHHLHRTGHHHPCLHRSHSSNLWSLLMTMICILLPLRGNPLTELRLHHLKRRRTNMRLHLRLRMPSLGVP